MRVSLMLALAATFAVPFEARAQEPPDAPSRTLRGHTFAYPFSIDAAFIDTFFGTRTTGRFESIANLPLGSRTTDVSSLGVAEDIDFELAVADRFSVGVGLTGGAIVGTSGLAISTAGAVYSYGATLDGAFRIVRLEESGTQIAVRGEVFGMQGGGRITLLPFIRSIRNEPASDVPTTLSNFGDLLVTPFSRTGASASINVAQALNAVFSLQASFRLAFHRTTQSPFVTGQGRVDVSSTKWVPQGGLAFGMIPPEWPVTFSAEYRISGQDSDDPTGSPRHLGALAAYYSGRPDLQLGPVVAGELGLPEIQGLDVNGDPKASDKRKAVWGQLMVRYYW